MHVLSTPPAFILSQDQTLHKNKCFSKKQGREKPENLTKNKPTHTTKSNAMQNWQILKLLLQTDPHPTRENKDRQTKNSYKTRIKSRTKQPARHHPKLEIQGQHHRHTPTTPKNIRRSQHNQARNQSTNKSTLAHYRVLKQHTHNHTPPGDHPVAVKSDFVDTTHTTTTKSKPCRP